MRRVSRLASIVFSAVCLLGSATSLAVPLAGRDTAGQTLYALGSIGDLYRISPYSASPGRFLITDLLYYRALAIDPTTLRAYGISWGHTAGQSDGELYEVNLSTGGHVRKIGFVNFPTGAFAMAFDAQGQAYVVENLDQNLYRLDKTTGALTVVGNTGYYLGAMTFDGNGTLYASVHTGSGRGNLVRIDARTGAATVIGTPGGMGGLAIDTDGVLYGAAGSDLYRIDKNSGQATTIGRVGISAINNLAFLRAPSGGGSTERPNLTPYQPPGWSDKVVITNDPGSRTDSPVLGADEPVFLNWAVVNNGVSSTGAPFWTRVYVDGVLLQQWQKPALDANADTSVEGYFLGAFAAGHYTLRLVVDATNAITEDSEGDNEHTKTFTVTSSAVTLSGPSSGEAFQRLTFTAATNGCQADPLGWSWSGDATLFLDSFGASGKAGASAIRGWISAGAHTVRVRNTQCGEAEATVDIRFPTRQVTQLYPEDPHDLPNLPTVVFCHGWQKKDFDYRDLWSCVGNCNTDVEHPVDELLGSGSRNVLQFVWSGAGQISGIPDASQYIKGWEFVDDAARRLAAALARRLPANFNQPIQFVGHSFGSVVCGRAAAEFLRQADVHKAQLTVLDRPDHIEKLPGNSQIKDFAQLAFDAQFFPALLKRTMRPDLDFLVDNYWSSTGLGVGDDMSCLAGAGVYNHSRPGHCPGCAAGFTGGLAHPYQVGDRYFKKESTLFVFDNDHSGVQQWYRWTMDAGRIAGARGDGEVCHGKEFSSPAGLFGPVFHGSLNPCEEGWKLSIIGPGEPVPNHDCAPATVEEQSVLACPGAACDLEPGELRAESPSQAAGAAVTAASMTVDIPVHARNLLFDLKATKPSASHWAAVMLDSVPVWSGSLSTFIHNQAVEIGPIPIYGLAGRRRVSVSVLGPQGTAVELSNLKIQRILVPCAAADALCISANRFRVEADWIDHDGNSGHATPRYVGTDASGFLWFFGPSNLELIVKVLNGCGVNNNFWVFAGGLTDVAVRLTVTDTATGAIRIYNNPQGKAFEPIQDTGAFATCTASDAASAAQRGGAVAIAGPAAPPEPHPARLVQGRFDVKATWTTPAGASGAGHFVPVTDETGYFWFFDPGNIEVVAKVLGGCGLNDRYWVFATGLTDVQVDLTITDTRSGVSRTYHNVQGQRFQPIQDTDAFATCP